MIEFDDGSGSVLRIQPLRTHRDEAIYECTATNSAGEINTSAKLTVLEGKISFFFLSTRFLISPHFVCERDLVLPGGGAAFPCFYSLTYKTISMFAVILQNY